MGMKAIKQMVIWVVMMTLVLSREELCASSSGDSVSILMIGNSLTMRKSNTTVRHLKEMAEKSGKKIRVEYVAHGNEQLKNWADKENKYGKKAYKAIAKRKWDYIVLQEHTDNAIARGKSLVSASEKLSKYIRRKCPDAEIIYNSTWAYDKTRKISGKSYSHEKQQANMDRNYKKAARLTKGRVCRSGDAFDLYRRGKGAKNLYLADKNHASEYGWYLNACCLYAAMFGEVPAGYYGGMEREQAERMQEAAMRANP